MDGEVSCVKVKLSGLGEEMSLFENGRSAVDMDILVLKESLEKTAAEISCFNKAIVENKARFSKIAVDIRKDVVNR